jgi:hypothetical protein
MHHGSESFMNNVLNFSDNTHVQSKIYQEILSQYCLHNQVHGIQQHVF